MSTSPSRSHPGTATLESKSHAGPQPFPYDLIALGVARGTSTENFPGRSARAVEDATADAASHEARARDQGRQEGQAEARKSFEEQLVRERASVVAALTQFTRDRSVYFQRVEGEVVQLALSIARKILHREAQIDPLLLAGIVRVALEKIDGATQVSLRIHPLQAPEWRKYLSQHMEASELPEIVEDPAQEPDRCVLHTSMGAAVVGVEVQLKEIEQGLLDLLAVRPGASS